MEDEEIEQVVANLREMLIRRGFDWAAVEADDVLHTMVAPRPQLLTLIDVAGI